MRAVRALGLSSSAPSKWKEVPAKYVLRIEAATGIPRRKLCPELFTPEDAVAVAADAQNSAAA